MFVVKVPGINGLGKTKGCEGAGNAILKALYSVHSNEQGREIDVKKLDLEEIHLDNSNLELSNQLIYKNAFNAFNEKQRVVFLGGDHSVSYGLTRAFFDSVENKGEGKKPCLIVFDSHADCMPSMKEPTHEEWLRKLIDDGFPVENILLIGVRNMWKSEKSFLKEKGVKMISINRINEDLVEMADVITEFASGKELYVSLDIDVVDPSFAPATGYCEPGGLTSRQMVYLMQRIAKIKTLRGVDVVEINVEKDKNHDNRTIKLGAKILSELI